MDSLLRGLMISLSGPPPLASDWPVSLPGTPIEEASIYTLRSDGVGVGRASAEQDDHVTVRVEAGCIPVSGYKHSR
jgi:hypothetical protein